MKMHRRLFLVSFIVCGLMTTVPLERASAQTNSEVAYRSQVLQFVNETRAQYGVKPLEPDAVLTAAAQKWAVHISNVERLDHKKDLGRGMGNTWTKLGENLGRGESIEAVYAAWMASPRHLANIVDPAFDSFGFGVVSQNGDFWMVQRFKQTR